MIKGRRILEGLYGLLLLSYEAADRSQVVHVIGRIVEVVVDAVETNVSWREGHDRWTDRWSRG